MAQALGVDPLGWALSGGRGLRAPLHRGGRTTRRTSAAPVTERTGTPVHRIGEVRPAGEGVRFLDAGRPRAGVEPGFDHFG